MSEPWYMQPAAGFARLEAGVDFLLVPGENPDQKNRNGAIRFTEDVVSWAEYYGERGWVGKIAAECQQSYAGAKEFWIWRFGKLEPMFEWLEFKYDDVDGVDQAVALHRGRGWRFPLIVFFDEEPTYAVLQALKRYDVPYSIRPVETKDWPPVVEEDPPVIIDGPPWYVVPIEELEEDWEDCRNNAQRLNVLYYMLVEIYRRVVL